jgi:hypothetical protein
MWDPGLDDTSDDNTSIQGQEPVETHGLSDTMIQPGHKTVLGVAGSIVVGNIHSYTMLSGGIVVDRDDIAVSRVNYQLQETFVVIGGGMRDDGASAKHRGDGYQAVGDSRHEAAQAHRHSYSKLSLRPSILSFLDTPQSGKSKQRVSLRCIGGSI